MVSGCTGFYKAVSGDSCSSVLAAWKITLADFTTWNLAVGKDCTSLWLDTYVCVVKGTIIGSASTTTTSTSTITAIIAKPTPTQSGSINDCKAFTPIRTGSTCKDVAKQYGLTVSQLVKFNPDFGTDCTNLVPGTYACVKI